LENGEFVSSHPGHKIRFTNTVFQPLGNLLQ
jgi:hypothetical protein